MTEEEYNAETERRKNIVTEFALCLCDEARKISRYSEVYGDVANVVYSADKPQKIQSYLNSDTVTVNFNVMVGKDGDWPVVRAVALLVNQTKEEVFKAISVSELAHFGGKGQWTNKRQVHYNTTLLSPAFIGESVVKKLRAFVEKHKLTNTGPLDFLAPMWMMIDNLHMPYEEPPCQTEVPQS